VIGADGTQEWYQNGQLHRVDGPAVIGADGARMWYIRGKKMTSEINQWMQANNITWPWPRETQVQFLLTWG
jgi:starvation-inducible outer membrane lipoprotein